MSRQVLSKRVTVLSLTLLLSCVACACTAKPDGDKVSNLVSTAQNQNSQNQNTQAEVKGPLPPPSGFVNDYAHVFNPESKKRLESVLTELRTKTDIEFAVVTVETTGGESIFDYSLAVAKGWGVGPKDTTKGGGLLLMLAVKDRQWRLQVSRSLEKDLPDDVSKELGEQSRGLYKQGKYADGATKYVAAIIGRLEEIKGFKLSEKL